MSFGFDVAIVGGGPIGSTLAYEIFKEGFSVAIFDKKKEIGIPLQCAGIVSKRLHEVNEIPTNLIMNKVKGAFIHSPNHILKVEKNRTEAFVIDRVAYDKFLAKRATDIGVKFFTKYEVNLVDVEKGVLGFKNGKKIKAKIIVGADGFNSIVSNSFNKNFNYFKGSQFLVKSIKNNNIPDLEGDYRLKKNSKMDDLKNDFKLNKGHDVNKFEEKNNHLDDNFVNLFINSKTLPGFLWSIPTTRNMYRVGLFSNNSYFEQNKLIKNFLENNKKFENCEIIEKYHGKIPIYDEKKKVVKKRAILIGDAASQLKPTTGGGLILGFEVVQIAKKYIKKSLNEDNISILKKYEEIFRKEYSNELRYQIKVQKTLKKLSDDDLDFMFFKLKEKDMDKLISKYGDMDKQSILVKEILKKGLIFSIIPSIIFRQVSKIWNLK